MHKPILAEFLVITILAFTQSALADTANLPDLITDRPDQTESTSIVLPGYYQIETGVNVTSSADGSKQSSGPSTLLRIGIAEWMELRLGVAGWLEGNAENPSGFGDAEVGFKSFLFSEAGIRPEAALLVHFSVPVGENGHSSDRSDPSFRLSFSHTLSKRISLGYNAGIAWSTEQEQFDTWSSEKLRGRAERAIQNLTEPFAPSGFIGARIWDDAIATAAARLVPQQKDRDTTSKFEYTLALGMDVSPRVGAYVELFGETPLSSDSSEEHYVDGGITFLLRDNMQLDLEAGAGLNDAADDWFVGAGLSVRFPN